MLSSGRASPQVFGLWLVHSATFRVVSKSLPCCPGRVSGQCVVWRGTFGPVGGPEPWISLSVLSGVFHWETLLSGHSAVKAGLNGVTVDLLQRPPICFRMSGAQPEPSLGFLVTLASPAQTVSSVQPQKKLNARNG